jgi:hypothetical protein
MTSILMATMMVLVRDEKSIRRDIEASERRAARHLVKEIFFHFPSNCLMGRVRDANVRDEHPTSTELYSSTSSFSELIDFDFMENALRCQTITAEAFCRLDIAKMFVAQRVAQYIPVRRKVSLISPHFHDEAKCLDASASAISESIAQCTLQPEYFCSAIDSTVFSDLTVEPQNAPHGRRIMFGAQIREPHRVLGPLIVSGQVLRGDVIALINGTRVWKLEDVREWESKMDVTELQYVTLLRRGRKVHVRVGLN